MTEDDTPLESLPRMHLHAFVPGGLDWLFCLRCGGPQQAHPSLEWLMEHDPVWEALRDD